MTTPHNPPRVQIPQGATAFPDVERAMVTVLDNILQELTPKGEAFAFLPENYQERIARGETIVTVQRTGGPAERVIDHARVHLSVTTGYRDDSWNVLGWLRAKLRDFSGVVTNSDGSVAIINSISDLEGPQRPPSITPDTRTVNAMLSVKTRLER